MVRPAEVVVGVLLFDVVVVGGYLLLTEPVGDVVWILPSFLLFSLVVAAYLVDRLSAGG